MTLTLYRGGGFCISGQLRYTLHMNYELEIQRDMPALLNSMNGGRPPLVAGSGTSTLLSAAVNNNFLAFCKDREKTEFTLEAWYLPVDVAGRVVVLGHSNEGVIFDGTSFELLIKTSAGDLSQKWTPNQIQSFHVALVYDTSQFRLVVNGELALTVNMAGNFSAANPNQIRTNHIISGSGTGIYDSVALYYRALSVDVLRRHYQMGRDIINSRSISGSRDGQTYDLVYGNVDIEETIIFNENNWGVGNYDNVSAYENIVANDETGGIWSFGIPQPDQTNLAGIHVAWVGSNVIGFYSLDGVTYTAINNGQTILEDFATTGGGIIFRFQLNDNTSWINSVRLDVLADRTLAPVSGVRMLNFKGASFDYELSHQLDYQIDRGATLRGGYIEIQPDTATVPANIRTIEMWARVDGATGRMLAVSGSAYVAIANNSYTFAGMTAYRNGVLVSNQSFPQKEWAHYVFVLNTGINTPVRAGTLLSGSDTLDMTVGNIASYATAYTAAQAAELYNSNVSTPLLSVVDNGVVTVQEYTPTVEMYAYPWSVIS